MLQCQLFVIYTNRQQQWDDRSAHVLMILWIAFDYYDVAKNNYYEYLPSV